MLGEHEFAKLHMYEQHIALDKNGPTKFFTWADSKEIFLTNSKALPSSWRYADSVGKLSYQYDSNGYRNSIELDDIQHDPYVVTIGCSHTKGVGQFYEETYSSHLQNLIKMPVYNMGLGAASNEVSLFNLMWLLNNFKHPKTIVFQKANIDRFPIRNPESPTEMIFIGPWISHNPEYFSELNQFMVIADKYKYNVLKSNMVEISLKQLCSMLNIELIILDINIEIASYPHEIDLARDQLHYGNDVNQYLANVIYEQMKH